MHICGSNYQLFGLNLIYSDCYIERNVRKMQGKMWISRKFLRQRLIKNNAEKKGVLRSPIFPNGAHLARFFEAKKSGAHSCYGIPYMYLQIFILPIGFFLWRFTTLWKSADKIAISASRSHGKIEENLTAPNKDPSCNWHMDFVWSQSWNKEDRAWDSSWKFLISGINE